LEQVIPEPALADPGFSTQEDQTAAASECMVKSVRELPQLFLSADEHIVSLLCRLCRGGDIEAGVLTQDRALEVAQRAPRFDAQFLAKLRSTCAIDLERLRLPPCTVQGKHQLAPQSLAKRMLLYERLELGDEILVAECEICVDALLHRSKSELLKTPDFR